MLGLIELSVFQVEPDPVLLDGIPLASRLIVQNVLRPQVPQRLQDAPFQVSLGLFGPLEDQPLQFNHSGVIQLSRLPRGQLCAIADFLSDGQELLVRMGAVSVE